MTVTDEKSQTKSSKADTDKSVGHVDLGQTTSQKTSEGKINPEALDNILKSINDISGRMDVMMQNMQQNKKDLEEIRRRKSDLAKRR